MTGPALAEIGRVGIVPVVVIRKESDAGPVAAALEDGCLPVMEITFRSEAAERAIAAVARMAPSILLGAGTVLTVEQVRKAVGAGARYIVSPGLQRTVVEYCLSESITVIPGALTPTEIGAALDLGIPVIKLFPAEAAGGIEYLKAVSAPFSGVKFIPTGGITAANAPGYLRLPSVHACGGSWMVKSDLIAAGRFDEIRSLAARAAALVVEVRGSVVNH